VLSVNAAIGRTEYERFAPIPGRVITHSEPKVSRAPQTEAHSHPVDEDHDDAELVFAGIREMCCGQEN
jgi:hypothetical protein